MIDRPKKRGKRVQIYIPADLVEQWERTPRYERSATVAAALRAWWAGLLHGPLDTAREGENVLDDA